MNRLPSILLLVLLPAILAQAATGNANAKNRTRGQKPGLYNLLVAGHYTGSGSATVSGNSISLSATVTRADGVSGTLDAPKITVIKDRFTATGTLLGSPCTLEGRLDLPAATDDETTDEQAVTGRITATVTDSAGKSCRIVGIQDEASRGNPHANNNPSLAPAKPAK